MLHTLTFKHGQSIQSDTDVWYRHLQKLGSGKNATTLLVMPSSGPHRGMLFALKVFERVADDESRKRFFKEIAFLQSCSHPSIMRAYDSGSFETQRGVHPFVVAEYFPENLRSIINAATTSIPQRLAYAIQLVAALEYLASLRPPVAHRDIKPDNIFIKGKACVLGDFGLMKRCTPSYNDTEDIFRDSQSAVMPHSYRTPDLLGYLRGEQVLTPATDVFQLGLVLAELFTGTNPARIPEDDPNGLVLDSIAHIPSELGGLINTTIRNMLEFDSEKRPSAEQVFDKWQNVFFMATERAYKLNEKSL